MKKKTARMLKIAALSAAVLWPQAQAAVTPVLQSTGQRTMMLREDGSLWLWGSAFSYRPDNDSNLKKLAPTRLGDGFVQAGLGDRFGLGLREDGSLWGWGRFGAWPDDEIARLMEDVRHIEVQRDSVLILDRQNRLWVMGRLDGRLSQSSSPASECQDTGTFLERPTPLISGVRSVRSVGAAFHAISAEGRLLVFNAFQGGKLVDLGFDPAGKPWRDFEPEQGARVQAADGGWHFPRLDGAADYCGDTTGSAWRLVAADAPPADRFKAQIFDNAHLSGLYQTLSDSYSNDEKHCFNQVGTLGYLKSDELRLVAMPTRLSGRHQWKDAFFALKKDGRVVACGSVDNWGQGAQPSFLEQPVPLGGQFAAISAGLAYSMALDQNGVAWGWGDKSLAGLGERKIIARNGPVQIGEDIKQIHAGNGIHVILKRDGSLWIWGNSDKHRPPITDLPVFQIPLSRLAAADFDIDTVVNRPDDVLVKHRDGRWSRWAYSALKSSHDPAVGIANGSWTELPGRFAQVDQHDLAVGEDGQLWVWGARAVQFDGDAATGLRALRKLAGDAAVDPTLGQPYAHVRREGDALLALGRDGRLWIGKMAAGKWLSFAQIGSEVAQAEFLAGKAIGLKQDGSLWRWPLQGDAAAVRLGGDFAKLDGHGGHLLLSDQTGRLWGMGEDRDGQLGVVAPRFRYNPAELRIDGEAQVSYQASGPLGRLNLTARLTPAAADLGRTGYYFVGAVPVGEAGLFSFDGKGWVHGAATAPVPLGTAQALQDRRVEVSAGLDLGGLAGTDLWLGYGVGADVESARADMAKRGLWRKVHKLR